MYKKVALAILIVAPLLAEFASHWTQGPAAQPITPAAPVVATVPAITAPRPAPIQYSAIAQPSSIPVAAAGPFDPVPTLDPTAIIGAPPVPVQQPLPPVSQEPPPARHNPPDDPERY